MDNQNLTNQKVDRDSTQSIDFHQRKITNAAPGSNSGDYVIKLQLDELQSKVAAALQKVGVTL